MSGPIAVQNEIQTTRVSPSPSAAPVIKKPDFSYERSVQAILKDREGRRTWSQLEDLEKRAETDPKARAALFRLETLNAAQEYSEKSGADRSPGKLAKLLDSSASRTERDGWNQVLRTKSFSDKQPVLKASKKTTGWKMLGYPPCIGKEVGPSSKALEQPERWNQLVTDALKKQLQPGEDDPKLKEYRRLYEAHKQVSSGKVRGRVSERSLYLDMKVLEEELLPEHLAKARTDAKTKILGGEEHERLHPQSRVRRFLGALSALPENSRERHMVLELSRVATKDPRELQNYAAHILDELKKCDSSLSNSLLPDFRKALAQVSREQAERQSQKRRLGTSEGFQNLLTALEGPKNGNSSEGDQLQLYRSGLTVNGTARDYTY